MGGKEDSEASQVFIFVVTRQHRPRLPRETHEDIVYIRISLHNDAKIRDLRVRFVFLCLKLLIDLKSTTS